MSAMTNGQRVLSLCNDYYDRVYRFVRKSTDDATAEDVTQDVFARLLEIDDLATRTIRISYLLKIADNMIKRRYHRTRRHGEIVEEIAMTRPSHAGTVRQPKPSQGQDLMRDLDTLLDRLSENEQRAIQLTVCCGLSHRDAARSLGVRMTTITNWKFRGLRKLESALRERGDDRQYRIAG